MRLLMMLGYACLCSFMQPTVCRPTAFHDAQDARQQGFVLQFQCVVQ